MIAFHEQVSLDLRQEGVTLLGDLAIPQNAVGIVLFAHGTGSSRLSPRNAYVAGQLQNAGIGSLLFDLLTAEEDLDDSRRFDIELLTARLVAAVGWIEKLPDARGLPIGLFGASTGAAAALRAAARLGSRIRAVVSRGGRCDLAGDELGSIRAPSLFIVGGRDEVVLELNEEAMSQIPTGVEIRMAIVGGATHLFEEPGALEEVSKLATRWFKGRLRENRS